MIGMVDKLRNYAKCYARDDADRVLTSDAADEIERLRAENDRFRKALEVIAGSSDKLQATQALGALPNIGAAVR